MSREESSETIGNFLGLVDCSDMDVLSSAVQTYGERNLDFVDCVLFAYHRERNIEIGTFDKKLLNLIRESDTES